MAITKGQGQTIKSLMQEERWGVLMKLLGDHITAINDEEIVGNNEFESLRMLHTNQGKVKGLEEFFDKLERGAFDD